MGRDNSSAKGAFDTKRVGSTEADISAGCGIPMENIYDTPPLGRGFVFPLVD